MYNNLGTMEHGTRMRTVLWSNQHRMVRIRDQSNMSEAFSARSVM